MRFDVDEVERKALARRYGEEKPAGRSVMVSQISHIVGEWLASLRDEEERRAEEQREDER